MNMPVGSGDQGQRHAGESPAQVRNARLAIVGVGREADDRSDGHAARLEADLEAMRRLYDLQAKLAIETDLKIALGAIVAAAADFTGTDRGCVQLVSKDGERLEMFVHRGYESDSPFIRHFLKNGSKPACDAARQNQQRTVIDDVATFPALLDTEDRRVALADDVRATQSTPLISRKGELVGVLSTQFRHPHRSSEHELKLIDMLAWTAADFVDRHLTETALRRANDDRFRKTLEIDTVPVVFFDFVGGITDANDAFLEMIGYTRAELDAGKVRYENLTPPDWAWRDEQTIAELKATGQSKPFEKEYFRRDESRLWIYCTGKMLDERSAVEFIVDLTERKQAEAALRELQERQEVLVAELQHRVRNMLTVVRSVFGRTVETGRDIDEVADHFRGRLDALARTQVIVTQSSRGLVDLESLIRDELMSVAAVEGPLLVIEGPDIALSSKQAESIGLAIHELTTNAVKYGALRVAGAMLSIRWTVSVDQDGARQVALAWIEQGVPAVPVKPAREGFGRELIEEALPYRLGAKTKLEFRGGGIRCDITLPLPDEGVSAVDPQEGS